MSATRVVTYPPETKAESEAEEAMREEATAYIRERFGLSIEEFGALSAEQRVQLFYDTGSAFVAIGVAATGRDGKPVTEQKAQDIRPDPRKPSAATKH